MTTKNEIVKTRLDINHDNRKLAIESKGTPADEKTKERAEYCIQETRQQYNEIWKLINKYYEEDGIEDTVDHDIDDFEVRAIGAWLDHCNFVIGCCREYWFFLPGKYSTRNKNRVKKDAVAFDGGSLVFIPEYIQCHIKEGVVDEQTKARIRLMVEDDVDKKIQQLKLDKEDEKRLCSEDQDTTCFDMLLECKWIGDMISSSWFLTIDPSRLSPIMGKLNAIYHLYDDTLNAIKGEYGDGGAAEIEINTRGIVEGINGIRFDIAELEAYLEVNDEEIHVAGHVRAYEIENGLFKRKKFSPQLEKDWAAIIERESNSGKPYVSPQLSPAKSLAFGFIERGDHLYHGNTRVILRPQQIKALRLLLNAPDVYIPNTALPGGYQNSTMRGSLSVYVSRINKWLMDHRVKAIVIAGEKDDYPAYCITAK